MNYFLVLYYFSSYLKAMDKTLPIYKSLILFGTSPIVGGNMAQFSSSVVDTAMLGHYDPKTLASASCSKLCIFHIAYSGGRLFVCTCASWWLHTMLAMKILLVRRNTRMAICGCQQCFQRLVFPILYWSDSVLMFLGQSAGTIAIRP